MSDIPEASLSILAQDIPVNSAPWAFGGVFLLGVVGMAYYASPMRLTRVLVDSIAATEMIYLEAVEHGVICASDVNAAEILSSLQFKVSAIREVTLRNSLSLRATLRDFAQGRTFEVLRCLSQVRALETHIEDPALDHLWCEQDTLTNLLKCLPSHLWEEDIVSPTFPERRVFRITGAIQNPD
ncbi:hypothetical protein MVEN_00978000 [Mycena venus]|uniref:Uncharacterized protein n=1 Tax=Mycena venus TaxID=2733690 RepID=A0A8H6YDR5_9AGAR|nr:hypothetical protein MVEN_00978000 [Mycena venus]